MLLQFAADFRPHGFIGGGDWLDFGSIAHHNKHKKRTIENLRIEEDLAYLGREVMAPIEDIDVDMDRWYLAGNHERFLEDLVDGEPGLADTLTVPKLLHLEERGWQWIPVGGHLDLGKLRFVHGDQLSIGTNAAKTAVDLHHKSIAFGHIHTHQQFITHSPVDARDIHIGIAVPGLATRAPAYARKHPNRWATGFLHGVIWPDGTFSHYVTIITNGRAWINGKAYHA